MFRHQGKSRTAKQNLQIATILSTVAGLVNVTGFLALQRLTTNVTGHFAFFIYDVTQLQFWKGTIYILYLLSFLCGSFVSSVLLLRMSESHKYNRFFFPILLEVLILIAIPLTKFYGLVLSNDVIACLLLFAMGLQNSLVTSISNAVVRTTHLTGLFTDLGIELSHLFFNKKNDNVEIKGNIKLRLFIISFFFLGGVLGGFLYTRIQLNTLIIAALILIAAILHDGFRYRLLLLKRKR